LAYPHVIEIDRKKYFALQAQKTEIEKKYRAAYSIV
jgi:hypothetical protein